MDGTGPTTGADLSRRQTVWHVALLAALCAAVFLPRIASLPLMDPEEPRCALIVREMVQRGDWVVMHLNGEVYYDKPAPYFWVTALATRLTGSAEAGGRSVSAVAAIVTVVLTYFLARRIVGPVGALAAGAMLATSGVFVFAARWYRMEMPFAACIWASLLCFWRMEDEFRRTGRMRRYGWYGFYAFCALGTLVKGPAGLALPGMVVGAYLLLSGRASRVFEPLHVGGIALYLLIAASWYVAIGLRDSAYLYEFLVVQNFGRYGASGRDQIFYATYVPVVLLGVLPWTGWLVEALFRMAPRPWKRRSEAPGVLFLYTALVVPVLFFSLSGTRLVHYVLPVFPATAVLMGGLVGRYLSAAEPPRWALRAFRITAVAVAVCPLVLGYFTEDLDALGAVPVAIAAAGLAGAWVLFRQGRRAAALGCIGCMVLGLYAFLIADDAMCVYERRSTRQLAALVEAQDKAGAVFLSLPRTYPSFEYYADVRVEHLHVEEIPKAVEVLRGDRRAYCLLDDEKDVKAVCEAAGGRAVVIGREYSTWLVSNRPARGTVPAGPGQGE